GTVGRRVGTNKVLIRLGSYSGWHIFPALLDSFLRGWESDGSRREEGVYGSAEVVAEFLKLINKFLNEADEPLTREFLDHMNAFPGRYPVAWGGEMSERMVGMVSILLSRCTTYQHSPPTELLTSCISILSSLLYYFPTVVWINLRAEVLFPRFSIESTIAGATGVGNSYMEQVVLPAEKSLGVYTTHLAFLDLLIELIKDAQSLSVVEEGTAPAERELRRVKGEVLFSWVVYAHRMVFAGYRGWRYKSVKDKDTIGKKILKIFNLVVRDSTWIRDAENLGDVGARGFGRIAEYLYFSFLEEGNLYFVAPLLDVVGVGMDEVERWYRQGRHTEGTEALETIRQGLTFLKRLLTREVLRPRKGSVLVGTVLDREMRSSSTGDPVELIHIIASYIKCETDWRVAALAIECLSLVCAVTEGFEQKPSLVGYFGNGDKAVVGSLLEYVCGSDVRNAWREELQCAVWRFLGVVVRTQPGLRNLFLVVDLESDQTSTATTTKAEFEKKNTLAAVMNVLTDWKWFAKFRWTVLPAALGVLAILWKNATEYPVFLTKLRSLPEFWKALEEILGEEFDVSSMKDEENRVGAACCFREAQGFVLRILGLEVYFMRQGSATAPGAVKNGNEDKIETIFKKVMKKSLEGTGLFLEGGGMPFEQALTNRLKQQALELNVPLSLSSYLLAEWADPFSGFRTFGSNYLYDVSLILAKFDKMRKMDRMGETEETFVRSMQAVNWNWSFTDAYMNVFRAWVEFLKVGALKLAASGGWDEVGGVVEGVVWGSLANGFQPFVVPDLPQHVMDSFEKTMKGLVTTMNSLLSVSILVPAAPLPEIDKVVRTGKIDIPQASEVSQYLPNMSPGLRSKVEDVIMKLVKAMQVYQEAYEEDKSALETELKFHRDLYVQHSEHISDLVDRMEEARKVIVAEVEGVGHSVAGLETKLRELVFTQDGVRQFLEESEKVLTGVSERVVRIVGSAPIEITQFTTAAG
ncbi:hypothetical protein HK097_011276, partial [Rhizophlyctis rosea]